MMQPFSTLCMRILLQFQMGAHSLLIVLSRRNGNPRVQRWCQPSVQHADGNERQHGFGCPALQGVRDKAFCTLLKWCLALWSSSVVAGNINGVAHLAWVAVTHSKFIGLHLTLLSM